MNSIVKNYEFLPELLQMSASMDNSLLLSTEFINKLKSKELSILAYICKSSRKN